MARTWSSLIEEIKELGRPLGFDSRKHLLTVEGGPKGVFIVCRACGTLQFLANGVSVRAIRKFETAHYLEVAS